MRLKMAGLAIATAVGLLVGRPLAHAQAFIGPASGGGSSGTVLESTFVYNGAMYPIVSGRVSFPDCSTYTVSPAGTLSDPSVTPNCRPGSAPSPEKPSPSRQPGSGQQTLNPFDLNAPRAQPPTATSVPANVKPAAAAPAVATGGQQTIDRSQPDQPPGQRTDASKFVGPADGGGWSGTLSNGLFVYRGVGYPIVNGVVTFPDCSTFFVSPRGDLFRGAPPALNCAPAQSGRVK